MKKLYNSPLIEVMNVNTVLMQHLDPPSKTEFPGGPAGAPIHWKEPVRRTPVF